MSESMWNIIQPYECYENYIKQNIRPDGRLLLETRSTTIDSGSITTANGSALVRLGDTSVVCGIKAELSQPTAAEPSKGIFVPNLDLSPLCAAHFKPGPPSNEAQSYSQLLYNIFHSCKMIDLEDLCICKDKLVWTLYCDIVCLNYDGNILDACVLAQTAALKNTSLPLVKYNEDENEITSVNNQKLKKLHIKCLPVSTTFSLFGDTYVIADPTMKEESITCGKLSVVTDEEDNICYIHRPGGSKLKQEQLEDCINIATKEANNKRGLVKV